MRFKNGILRPGLSLTRQDLILLEHQLKEDVASFLPFKSCSLFFPAALPTLPEGVRSALSGGDGLPVAIPSERSVLVPLCQGGETLAVLVAKGAKLPASRAARELLGRLATMSLSKLALFKQAITDPLTGLFTRDFFLENLEREIEVVQHSILPASRLDFEAGPGYRGSLGLVLADLDRFTPLIDRLGHGFGQDLLARAARTLVAACPGQVIPARLADDLFAFLCPEGTEAACTQLAERLRACVEAMEVEAGLTGGRVEVTASLGLATYPRDLTGPQLSKSAPEQARLLLKKARRALSAAKELGRNRVFVFSRLLEEGGSILEVLPMGRLTVSLGRTADAREGQRFLVWSPKFPRHAEIKLSDEERLSGRYPAMYKAEVVLIEVQGDLAFAETLQLSDPAWAIEPGDRITHVPDGLALAGPQAEPAQPQKDMVTGLYNFRDFLGYLSRARQASKRFAMAMLRPAREPSDKSPRQLDAMLQDVALLLKEALPPEDTGCRFSLASLVYFQPGLGPDEAMALWRTAADRVREALGIELAVGVAVFPFLGFGRADVLENCRKALDHALLLGEPPLIARFDSVSLNISADRHFAQGDLYGAVEEYKLSLLADPANLLARNSLGICHARLSQLDKARRDFEAVARKDAGNLMAVYNLGCVSMKMGDLPAARRAFLRCLKKNPEHVFSLIRLGRLAAQAGSPSRARRYFERAAKAGGERFVRRDLASLSLERGRLEEAREHLHQALVLEEAREHLHQALVANPQDSASLHLLATIHLDSGEDPEIAETLARQCASLQPGQPEHWELLARALDAQGKTQEAREARDLARQG